MEFQEKCPICLEDQIKNPSILHPCMHTFCSECINEWLGRSQQCPLCKQKILGLVHDIKSDTDYKMFKFDPNVSIPYHPYRVKIYDNGFEVLFDKRIHNVPFSLDFYVKNQKLYENRILKWIQRELETIFKSYSVEQTSVFINSLLSIYEIKDEEFYENIKEYLKENTRKFIQELYLFCKSNLNMDIYDKKVEYLESVD